MEYIQAYWFHHFEDEPNTFYHEVDDSRQEIRKIEVYRDGSFGMASAAFNFGGTQLAHQPLPAVEQINDDSQFMASRIDKETFEKHWHSYSHYLAQEK